MKNTALLIITTAALLSSFQTGFSQTVDAPKLVDIAFACKSEGISAGGFAQFADNGVTSSCTRADFDSSRVDVAPANVSTPVEPDHCFYEGKNYSAFIDNQSVALNCYQPVNAVLVNEPSSGDVDAARTVIDITINGKDVTMQGGKLLNETIQLRLALVEPISPESASCSVSLYDNGATYSMVKGDASNVEVTDFVWSMDRKGFILSVQYNCTMRSLGFPADGVRDVNLKGKLLRVHVTNAGAVAESE